MEPCCRMLWQGPHRSRAPWSHRARVPAHIHALLLLLLLLPPSGCVGASHAPGTPAAATRTWASSRPRPPHQTLTSPMPVSSAAPVFEPSCGSSFEQDPTLRDAEAMARRAPWMVSVRANNTHVCAGTLIASHWVLTVAHCVSQHDVNYTVRVGSPWIDQLTLTSSDVPVLQVIRNPGYHPHRYWSWVGQANNIALLKLQHPLHYSKYVWPICLPDLDVKVDDGYLCTVMGWGLSQADGVWPQFRTIQEKEVTVLSNRRCDDFYHNFSAVSSLVWVITSKMICAEDPSREQFCYEATGEPLVCSLEGISYLVGLASWGAGCEKSEAPPIFLRVSPYQSWISAQLSGEPPGLCPPSRALLLALPLPFSLLAAL